MEYRGGTLARDYLDGFLVYAIGNGVIVLDQAKDPGWRTAGRLTE